MDGLTDAMYARPRWHTTKTGLPRLAKAIAGLSDREDSKNSKYEFILKLEMMRQRSHELDIVQWTTVHLLPFMKNSKNTNFVFFFKESGYS